MATVRDIALTADSFDDRIVARYGGQRMQDVVEESAMSHILGVEEGHNPFDDGA